VGDYSFAVTGTGTTVTYNATTVYLAGWELSLANFTETEIDAGMRLSYDNDGTDTSTGGGGNTVICTHMYASGYIPPEVYKWDAVYGQHLGAEVLRGYHAWAIPLVEHVLKKSALATRIVRPLACGWALEMAHRCDPLSHPAGSALGRAMLAVGVPICRALGRVLQERDAHRSTARVFRKT